MSMADVKEPGSDVVVEIENEQDLALATMRHSAAHLMAEAVQELIPEVKFAIGPAIENGFYYDMDLPRPLSPDDLASIENLMARHRDADEPFVRTEVSKSEALEIVQGKPIQGRDTEGVAGRLDDHDVSAGHVPRSLQGTACRIDGRDRRIQVALSRRRLLAGR